MRRRTPQCNLIFRETPDRLLVLTRTILTRPNQPHAPITMDEHNTCSITPLHWLCMQHIEGSASADTVPLWTLRAVVGAYPEAVSIVVRVFYRFMLFSTVLCCFSMGLCCFYIV